MDTVRWIDANRARFAAMADAIWEFAETRYAEVRSAALLADALEGAGFAVERSLAGIPTAFVATYGTGSPTIALLGEYDALPGLSQDRTAVRAPLQPNGSGHGCGHNLLGVGALAAALSVKEAIQAGHVSGTVRYYGCPAEEIGAGKAFMVKAGVFAGVDLSLTWHPDTLNGVVDSSYLARWMAHFRFHGRSAHAAFDPYNGRSALDAVELMNVGVNYLREHINPEARIHYIITSGGEAPNIVPAQAESLYQIRAPRSDQVREISDRVTDVARGAALMTGTEFEVLFHSAVSNVLLNDTIAEVLERKLSEVGAPAFDAVETAFARAIQATLRASPDELAGRLEVDVQTAAAMLRDVALCDRVKPRRKTAQATPGSTDVGDVSWVTPTGQVLTACQALGTPGHSWQIVAQSGMGIGHKGMIYAAQALSAAAVEFMQRPELVQQARDEFAARTKIMPYVSPIPDGATPPIGE